MNTLKTIITSALVALIVTGGIWLVLPSKTPVIGANAVFGNTSIDGSQSNLPNPSNSDYAVARLALGLGTAMTNSSSGAGNINLEAVRQVIATATTTTCSIANPFLATSTILSFSYNITVGTSTPAAGIDYTVGTTTTAFATSTNMVADQYVAAGAQKTITWDPGANNSVLSANQFITVGALASSTITGTGGIVTGGTCAATFESL